jgi:hypothetical protein
VAGGSEDGKDQAAVVGGNLVFSSMAKVSDHYFTVSLPSIMSYVGHFWGL